MKQSEISVSLQKACPNQSKAAPVESQGPVTAMGTPETEKDFEDGTNAADSSKIEVNLQIFDFRLKTSRLELLRPEVTEMADWKAVFGDTSNKSVPHSPFISFLFFLFLCYRSLMMVLCD